MSVAESCFAMDQMGRKIGEKQFGFLQYLQYSLYEWMRALGIKTSWNKMEEIDKAR